MAYIKKKDQDPYELIDIIDSSFFKKTKGLDKLNKAWRILGDKFIGGKISRDNMTVLTKFLSEYSRSLEREETKSLGKKISVLENNLNELINMRAHDATK